jgi:hypothetical protein
MNVIHRFPHGATRRPGPDRPSSGYGRPVGRPGPRGALRRLRPAPFEPDRLVGVADPLPAEESVAVEESERSRDPRSVSW